jgi:hypothetical protein
MITSDPRHGPRCYRRTVWCRLWLKLKRRLFHRCFWLGFLLILAVLLSIFSASTRWKSTGNSTNRIEDTSRRPVLQPAVSAVSESSEDPERWLLAHSENRYAYNRERSWQDLFYYSHWSPRPIAALISLVRNEELNGIMQSMRQLEHHWNHKYRYPWIFFNEQPFSDEFKVSLECPPAGTASLLGRPQLQTLRARLATTKLSPQSTGTHQTG